MYSTQMIEKYRDFKIGVRHTTFNIEGPGSVRIFLIPPKWKLVSKAPSIVILNGYYMIPVGYSWAVVLGILIDEINDYNSNQIALSEYNKILDKVVTKAGKIYKLTKNKKIRKDLEAMMQTFFDVANDVEPTLNIGTLSLNEYAKHMYAPHRMDLMISSMAKDGKWNCNQYCLHCYASGQKEAITDELTTSQWKDVLDNCRAAGIPQVTFTGGEPTMRNDLVELVEHGRWFVTRLNTNGVNLTSELCKNLKAASLDSVQVTLYSHNKNIHNELVGIDYFDQTIKGLNNALNASLDVSVNTPLCSINKDYTQTLKFLYEQGVTFVTCSGLILTGNATNNNSTNTRLSSEELFEVLKEAKSYADSVGIELTFTSPGWISEELLKTINVFTPACGACLSNMAISPDGEVVPCQSWLSDGSSLGNILTDEWKSIWNSKKAKSIRKSGLNNITNCPLKDQQEEAEL